MNAIHADIRKLLACPKCRGPLDDAGSADRPTLRCAACALAYPVEQGIPVLLIERAMAAPGANPG